MSDPDSSLTPAQDDAVRAHLASARHTDAIPPDVAARLDATLASLQQERLGPEQGTPVVTLASRRRRRAVTALLGAAAAVVAAVGIGQVLPDLVGSGSDSASTADSSSAGSAQAPEREQEDLTFQSEGDAAEEEGATKDGQRARKQATSPGAAASRAVPALSSAEDIRPQVRALRRDYYLSSFIAPPTCPVAGVGTSSQVDVTYDELPAVLVYRDPTGGFQRAEIYLCGAGEPLHSVRLRAR